MTVLRFRKVVFSFKMVNNIYCFHTNHFQRRAFGSVVLATDNGSFPTNMSDFFKRIYLWRKYLFLSAECIQCSPGQTLMDKNNKNIC